MMRLIIICKRRGDNSLIDDRIIGDLKNKIETCCAFANKFFKRKDFQLLTFILSKQSMRIFAFEAYT